MNKIVVKKKVGVKKSGQKMVEKKVGSKKVREKNQKIKKKVALKGQNKLWWKLPLSSCLA